MDETYKKTGHTRDELSLRQENNQLRLQLVKLSQNLVSPPIVMMEPEMVVKKYRAARKEMASYKKIFFNIYIKVQDNDTQF